MSTYLVTGGAGFIGSNIVEELVRRGERVRVLDDFSTGRRENVESFRDRIEVIEGDIRDEATVRRAVEGVHFVLHQAAIPSVLRSVEQPVLTSDVNILGTLRVLMAARDARVRRVVFASSSSVYGDSTELPKREAMTPQPLSPYALQKLTGEHLCRLFSALYGLETVSLRYFNVFGPRQNPASQYAAVVPNFIAALRDGRPPRIDGDGRQTRDFTFVADVVEANLQACHARQEAVGRVVNIACGRQYSILQLLDQIRRILASTMEPTFGPARPGDVRHSLADITEARRLLGFEPRTPFAEGLRRTASWFDGR